MVCLKGNQGGGQQKNYILKKKKSCISRNAVAVALVCDTLNMCIQFRYVWYASCNEAFGSHKMSFKVLVILQNYKIS